MKHSASEEKFKIQTSFTVTRISRTRWEYR